MEELFLSLAKSALPFDFNGLRAEEPNGVLELRVGEPIADRVGDKFPALSLLCANDSLLLRNFEYTEARAPDAPSPLFARPITSPSDEVLVNFKLSNISLTSRDFLTSVIAVLFPVFRKG